MAICPQRTCNGHAARRTASERAAGIGRVRKLGRFAVVLGATLALSGVCSWWNSNAWAADGHIQQAAPASADQEMQRGAARFHQGAFAQAAVHWSNAVRLYEEDEKTEEQCRALINLAHALHQEGQIKKAMVALQAALNLSEQAGNRPLTDSILGRLGNAA